MKMITGFFVLLMVILPFYHSPGGDYVNSGWCAGLGCLLIYIALILKRNNGWAPALVFGCFTLNALYIAAFRQNRYMESDIAVRFVFTGSAFYFLVAALLFLMVFTDLSRRRLAFQLERYFAYICIADSFFVIFWMLFLKKLPAGPGWSGFIDYASMNGCLIAMTAPCFWFHLTRYFQRKQTHYISYLVFLVPIVSIALSHSSSPWGALFGSVFGMFAIAAKVSKGRDRKDFLVAGYVFLMLLMLLAYFFERGSLLDSAGRMSAWKIFMHAWYEKLPVLWGSGPGTFPTLAIETQVAEHYLVNEAGTAGTFFTFLHNEWLQVLYEEGAVGLLLLTIWFIRCLRLAWQNSDQIMLAGLLSTAICSCVVFPMRYFLTAMVGAWFFIGTEMLYGRQRD